MRDDTGLWYPMRGPAHYQVRVEAPGGRIMLCGASGGRRDWIREDYADLTGHHERHITVVRISHLSIRRERARRVLLERVAGLLARTVAERGQ
jgi:hypothetical protein